MGWILVVVLGAAGTHTWFVSADSWRASKATLRSPSRERPDRRGGIRLDNPAALAVEHLADDEVGWPEPEEARA